MIKKLKDKKTLNAKRLTLNADKGFTLIETLIYVAIVGGFITTSVLLAYQIIDFSGALEKQRELGENQRFLVQKLNWVLGGTGTITVPAKGNTSPTLEVGSMIVDAQGGIIRLNGVNLTNSYAAVSDLQFEHLDFSGKSAIRVTATLSNDAYTTTIDSTIIIN